VVEIEFEVIRRDGHVHIMAYDDEDNLEVITLDPASAKALAEAMYAKAILEEDDESL
jgi:hypothetical protein